MLMGPGQHPGLLLRLCANHHLCRLLKHGICEWTDRTVKTVFSIAGHFVLPFRLADETRAGLHSSRRFRNIAPA